MPPIPASAATALEFIKRLPLIRDWRRKRHFAHFVSREGFTSRYGVFENFADARSILPKSREFDSKALAT